MTIEFKLPIFTRAYMGITFALYSAVKCVFIMLLFHLATIMLDIFSANDCLYNCLCEVQYQPIMCDTKQQKQLKLLFYEGKLYNFDDIKTNI